MPTNGIACEYSQTEESFAQIVDKADVIFYGKPILIGKRYAEPISSKDVKAITEVYFSAPHEVQFEVIKSWKGAEGRDVYMLDEISSCGAGFYQQLEKEMLIFAKFDDDGLKNMLIGSTIFNDMSQQQRIDALGPPTWQYE